jgi:Domain of unknown function (DUF4397)
MKTCTKGISSLALPVLGLIITILFFAACKKPGTDMPDAPVAGVMAFNLASDQHAAVFTLNGNRLGTNLGYNAYTGNYLPAYTGNREVRTVDFFSGRTIAQSNATFADSAYYSAFLMGVDSNYRHVIVKDEVESISPATGKAWVRYVNAIPDSSTTHTVTIGTANQTAAYASVSGFVQVDAGALPVAITNSSSINASRTINVEENKVYTILFTGLPNPTEPETAVQIRFIQNGTATSNN